MNKREKLIRGLKTCLRYENFGDCEQFPYIETCQAGIMKDMLNLLEEREPIEATEKQKIFAEKFGITVPQYWCGECHYMIVFLTRFCPNCGKKVKWDA